MRLRLRRPARQSAWAPPPGARALHVSQVEAFGDCPAAYDFAVNHQVAEQGYCSALAVGSAMHAATAALRRAWDPRTETISAAAAVLDATPKPRPEDKQQALADSARLVAMVDGYWARWENAPLCTTRNEVTLRAPLRNPATGAESKTFYVEGTLDAILDSPGGPLVYEQKTTSDTLDEVEAYLRNGLQIPIYQYLLRCSVGEPGGAVLDIVKKPVVKRRAAQGESLPAWGKRCLDDYAARPDHFFRRAEAPYDETRVNWALGVFWQVAEEIRNSDRHGYRAVRSLHVCRGSLGWCRYRNLCWYAEVPDFTANQTSDLTQITQTKGAEK